MNCSVLEKNIHTWWWHLRVEGNESARVGVLTTILEWPLCKVFLDMHAVLPKRCSRIWTEVCTFRFFECTHWFSGPTEWVSSGRRIERKSKEA